MKTSFRSLNHELLPQIFPTGPSSGARLFVLIKKEVSVWRFCFLNIIICDVAQILPGHPSQKLKDGFYSLVRYMALIHCLQRLSLQTVFTGRLYRLSLQAEVSRVYRLRTPVPQNKWWSNYSLGIDGIKKECPLMLLWDVLSCFFECVCACGEGGSIVLA